MGPSPRRRTTGYQTRPVAIHLHTKTDLNLLVILVWTRAQNKLKVGLFMQKRINVDAAKINAGISK